jgi:branched-chain amino acid transport system permease protein
MRILIIQLFVNGLITASFYALAGVSWGVIYRTTHIFHFSHHLVCSVAGYAAILAPTEAHLLCLRLFCRRGRACSLAAALMPAYTGLCGGGSRRQPPFSPLLGLGPQSRHPALAFTSSPRRLVGFPTKVLSIGEAFLFGDLTMAIISWAMIGFLLFFLAKSRWGKAIRAVAATWKWPGMWG